MKRPSRVRWMRALKSSTRLGGAALGLLVFAALWFAEAADLTNASARPEDWVVRAWQTKDGMPQNTVNAIAQTRDGYLWVGTSGGLARFDGVRFRAFGLQDGLRSVRISTLLEDHQGVLWVGTTGGGLSRWEKGRFIALAGAEELGGADVIATATEPDGTVWIGTDRGLLKWRDGVISKLGPAEGLPANQIRALLLDSKGTFWVSAVPGGLFQGTRGRFVPTPRTPAAPNAVYSLLEDREGSLWAGSDTGVLWQWRGGLWQRYGETNGLPKSNIEALAQGTDQVIWVGTRNSGLYFFSEGSFHRLGGRTGVGLEEGAARRLLVDRDGTMWVGTAGAGLSRLSRRLFHHWGLTEGLKHPSVTAVAEDVAGGLWVGTQEGGIYRFLDRGFNKLVDPAVSGNYPYIYSALATADGSVWVAGEQCLFHFRKDAPTRSYLGTPIRGEAIRALCADGTNLWLGTYYSTLLQCDGTNVRVVATNGSFGGDIRSLVREASDTLWVGSASGLYRWERGQVRVWTTRDGLLTASVQSLHREPDGTLWIGTLGGGLARLKHGRIANITTRQGLIDDVVSQIVSDDFGHLWLGCNHGIMRLAKRELEDCADGTVLSVSATAFGENEGMLTEQCAGGHSPTALKTKDGRLVFPTIRGIVEMDPRRCQEVTTEPPQATIEELVLDGQIQNPAGPMVVAPGKHRLEVNYTAPSLRGADWVRFRHRLQPLDEDWVNAGTRRTASYDHLRPGRYVFRVTASDNRGTWNENAASVAIAVQPQFWQTLWFQTLGGLAMVAAGFFGYRVRIARLEKRRVAQEAFTRQLIAAQENERARLGRELHDDITQRLARLAIDVGRCELGTAEASPAETAREVREGLVRLSEDVHALSYRLHPAVLEDLGLAEAMKAECERFSGRESIRATVKLREVPESVPRDAALCLFRVAQEALRNAARHAQAHAVEVSLRGLDGGLQLAVQDDGCGFNPALQQDRPTLGLASMRERVHLLGGELEVESAPGRGTIILAWVPVGERLKAEG